MGVLVLNFWQMVLIMQTVLVYAPALAHTKFNHPESHHRLASLMPALEQYAILSEVKRIIPAPATIQQLQRVHNLNLIEMVRQVSQGGGGLLDAGDTYATAESYNLAQLAAGACCQAIDQIMTEQAKNGFALIRPPGHHAESHRISGFCLFNNVAVAARQAQYIHGVKRVAIIDFDVHHGNGTQDIFYKDDSVLFASIHLFAPFFYPGVGSFNEVGDELGQGFTVNVPLPPHVGDEGYARILEELIIPKVTAFQPEILLISAGFDAHWQDPLAMAGLSLTGFASMARKLITLAEQLCNGRILFILEGGYKLDVLTLGIVNVFYALLNVDRIEDGIGPMTHNEQDISSLLTRLKQRHLLI